MNYLIVYSVLVSFLSSALQAMEVPSLKKLAQACFIKHTIAVNVPHLEQLPRDLKEELFDLLRAPCEAFCWRYCAEYKEYKLDDKAITAIALTADGSTFFAGKSNGEVAIVALDEEKPVESFNAHTQRINSLILTRDDSFIITSAADKRVRIWHRSTKELVKEFLHQSEIWSSAFQESESLLLTGCFDNKAYLWDANTGTCIHVLNGHTKKVYAVAFGPGESYLVTAARDTECSFKVCLWNRKTGALITTLDSLPNQGFNSCVVAYDGMFALESTGIDPIAKWDINKKEVCAHFMPYSSLAPLAIAPSNEYIVAQGCKDKEDSLWIHTLQGALIKQLRNLHKGIITSVAINRKNTSIAVGFSNGLVQVWTCKSTYDSLDSLDKRLLIRACMQYLEHKFPNT